MQLPPYDTYPEIQSEQITLRQVRPDDMKDLVEISFYDARPAVTVQDALEMQEKIDLDYQNGDSIHWAIIDRQTKKIVGTLGYYRGFDKGIGELGCVLKTEFYGHGFMTLAMKLACEFGTNDMGLTEIRAVTSKENTAAIKLFERVNFIKIADLDDGDSEYVYVNKPA